MLYQETTNRQYLVAQRLDEDIQSICLVLLATRERPTISDIECQPGGHSLEHRSQ